MNDGEELFSHINLHLSAESQRVPEIATFLPTWVKKINVLICWKQAREEVIDMGIFSPGCNMFLTQPPAGVDVYLPVISLLLA